MANDLLMPGHVEGRAPRPWLAALLSFIFPGLGQAYAGRPVVAAVLALPVVALIVVAVVLVGVLGEALRNSLLSSGFLITVLALNVVLLLWRAFAISDAGLTTAHAVRRRERQIAVVAVVALLAATLAMHGWVGIVVAHLDGTLTQVFSGADANGIGGGGNGGETGDGEGKPGDPDASGVPVANPMAEPEYSWDGEERINILLLGTDAAPGRDRIITTDVIMLLSVDPATETAVMISVPRDTGFMPLPDSSIYADGVFPGKANALAATAAQNPARWCPDMSEEVEPTRCGIEALQRSVELYTGTAIHYYAIVDMAGFAELIDALGGVELCLPGRLVDPDFGHTMSAAPGGRLVLPAGCHHYDGLEALAYARSRQGWIVMPDGERVQQTDFDRNERQQRVLLALRNELADADLIFELPAVLTAIGRTVSTDFPRDRAGDLASLLPMITASDIERVVLGHPEFVDLPLQPNVNYILTPRRDAIRDEMARIFGRDELSGWYLGTDGPAPARADADEVGQTGDPLP